MIIYDKFEYKIKVFGKTDGIELFKYFTENRLGDRREVGVSEYSEKRKSLKMAVNEALNASNHIPIGLYKKDKLIGVCLSFSDKKNGNVPTVRYIHIDKNEIDGFGKYVMFHVLTNIMYEDTDIKVKNEQLKEFGDITFMFPRTVGYSVINKNFKDKLNNYFKDK